MVGNSSMEQDKILQNIREELFYGATDYTKNQPDLFVPHRFRMLAPSQVNQYLQKLEQGLPEKEILIYVHLPFCFSECLFCNSFPLPADASLQNDYLRGLLKEIDLMAASGIFAGKKARCIYFGGGTPTLFPNSALESILDRIRAAIPPAEGCSITTEAHPATVASRERIAGLAKAGVNRISMGCQTFDPELLVLCNRSNSEELIKQVVDYAHDAGIRVNIDMMAGLPGQTLRSLANDLAALERIRPDAVEYIRHEIVNPLVVDLYKSRPDLVVSDDTLFEMDEGFGVRAERQLYQRPAVGVPLSLAAGDADHRLRPAHPLLCDHPLLRQARRPPHLPQNGRKRYPPHRQAYRAYQERTDVPYPHAAGTAGKRPGCRELSAQIL